MRKFKPKVIKFGWYDTCEDQPWIYGSLKRSLKVLSTRRN